MYLIIAAGVLGLFVLSIFVSMLYRIVVPTNEVHIVQSGKQTLSYGKGLTGNTYYRWPSWIPKYGVVTSKFPLSVFDIELISYPAYDSGRVPFTVDVMGFFRVAESDVAAERVFTFEELKVQLEFILKSAVRTILASNEIEDIMQGRSKFGEQFTAEVDGQLKEWGVQSVKNIEFMDIRDSEGSEVIHNIMEKKKSLIEKQSRIEVANNMRDAELAEIDAKRSADVQRQDAEQQVGTRIAEKEQVIGIAKEKSNQAIQVEAKVTATNEMAVKEVQEVRSAEIKKSVELVTAEQEKQKIVLQAEGNLRKVTLDAEGVRLEGEAKADAEKAFQMAPVQAQIALAAEIGNNQGYQTYLISVETIKKDQVVGTAQAEALKAAGIKVIANTGDVQSGVNSVLDLFTSKGGTSVGASLEALAQTDIGKDLLARLGIGGTPAAVTVPAKAEVKPAVITEVITDKSASKKPRQPGAAN